MRVYRGLPGPLQDAAVTVEGLRRRRWRYGGVHADHVRLFTEAADWSSDRLAAWQRERLVAHVRHAATRVPYYRQLFARLGLAPDAVRAVEDLPKLPVLERADVVRASRDLIADGWPSRDLWAHPSGGSTGMPLTIYTSTRQMQVDYAFHWARRRPGVSPSDRFATFTGNMVVPQEASAPPFWRTNYGDYAGGARQRLYSVFHLAEANLRSYVDDLHAFAPRSIWGYPSAVHAVADWMVRHDACLPPDGASPVAAFFSTSEVLLPEWRADIARAFGCRVWDNYGQGESAGSITEYPCGHLHVDGDYGVVELLPVGRTDDGLVRAEIVATSLHNTAWPLLRYRTGDLAVYDPEATCAFGRHGQVIARIEGRTSQFFELPDGRRITSLMGLSIHCRNTRSIQVVQDAPGAIVVHAVPGPGFTPADEALIVDVFRGRLGDQVELAVRLADAPLLSGSGKFLAILNRARPDSATRDAPGDPS
jgi:phenylacetate-CoA ligase